MRLVDFRSSTGGSDPYASLEQISQRMKAFPGVLAGKIGEVIYDGALTASLGPYSTAQLGEMYNPYGPYSVRSPHPPMHPGIINFQTGTFYRNWQQLTRSSSHWILISTFNTSPYANALATGTDLMIMRPLPELVGERVSKRIDALTDQAGAQLALP